MTRLVAALVVALAVGGCGTPGSSPEDVLSETAANLGEIESGDLSLEVVVTSGGQDVGFALDGPFALAKPGGLPVANVEYTQIAGPERATATFVSTGQEAFVVVGGATYELPDEQEDDLRGARGAGEALDELAIDDWIDEPELSDGGEVGGADTDRIRARLDAVEAANDLLRLASQLGADVGPLAGKSREQLARAVESGTIEVFTGKDDRLLRRLVIEARLGADVPRELESALGDLAEARFRLEMTIADPNEPVTVDEPANAQPFPGG